LKEQHVSWSKLDCAKIATYRAKKQQKPAIAKNGGDPNWREIPSIRVKPSPNAPHKFINRIIIPLKYFKFIGRRSIAGESEHISFRHKDMTILHNEYVPHTLAAKKRAALPGNQPIGSMRDFGFPCSRRDFGKGE
jgi:hypothetical protein